MKAAVSLEQVNQFLLGKQHLDSQGEQTAEGLLARLGGCYGSAPTCYLSLLPRLPGFRFEELDEAVGARRALVRLRCMRGSLFLLPTSQLPVTFQATRQQCLAAFGRLVEGSGVGRAEYEGAAARVEAALAGRSLSVAGLKAELPGEREGVLRALNFVVSLMCAEGRLVRAGAQGGWKSNLWEYARLGEWLPGVRLESVTPAAARAELARLYFEGFGPATAEDFQWWSGLSKPETAAALAALADELCPVVIKELPGEYLMLGSERGRLGDGRRGRRPRVSLLPMWDAYTMAYKSKQRYLDERRRAHVYDRAGNAAPAVLLDGRLGGVWEWSQKRREVFVKVALFERAGARVWAELKEAAGRFAAAVGGEATLLRCHIPRPGAGGDINFRSPLAGLDGEAVG